jgi:1-acyl-sn-glycerol-3-phosphate acyltransferase
VLRPEAARQPGPYILASSHLSHLEPFLLSILLHRQQIDWMARVEFYTYGVFARLMRVANAISVRRYGVAASAIRTALARLAAGRVVGICPEGGVAQGKLSVMRGGPIKRGVCLISMRSGVPVLPCIMLGTDKLNRVFPWLPIKQGRLWIAFGPRLVHPPVPAPRDRVARRAARDAMADELTREYMALYQEVLRTYLLEDAAVP